MFRSLTLMIIKCMLLALEAAIVGARRYIRLEEPMAHPIICFITDKSDEMISTWFF